MPIDQRPPAIFLMGPTAAGKTALACALAERFPLDLISVDSALVYCGLNIGAAKPEGATRARFPHRLMISGIPPRLSAAEFARCATRNAGRQRGRARRCSSAAQVFRALQYGLRHWRPMRRRASTGAEAPRFRPGRRRTRARTSSTRRRAHKADRCPADPARARSHHADRQAAVRAARRCAVALRVSRAQAGPRAG